MWWFPRVRSARSACFSAAGTSPTPCRAYRRSWAAWFAPITKLCSAPAPANNKVNYSEGIAITSIFYADPVTTVEPVRYPAGSSLMRFLTGPLVEMDGSIPRRLFITLITMFKQPLDFLKTHVTPGWAQRTTILLVMQTEDNHFHMQLGRSFWTLFSRNLVSDTSQGHGIPAKLEIGHEVTRRFSKKTNGIPAGSINEAVLNVPLTAHILGGCPMGHE